MEFKLIEVSKWSRKEYFEYYLHQVNCTYSIALNLDLTILISEIKKREIKFYPIIIYLISLIVNKHAEFRTAIDANEHVGVFSLLHPSYTVFQKDSQTFTNIWTEYSSIFSEFYEQYLADIKSYSEIKSLLAKPNTPSNVFNISSIPWVSFTGFNLNLPQTKNYLLPIFTVGKYFEQNGAIGLPIAIQVHHAVCDGFHIARFINELQEAMNTLFKDN